jgi:hypothetical protein
MSVKFVEPYEFKIRRGMQAKPISHALARGATHVVTLLPLHVERTSAPPSIRNPRLKECDVAWS